mmetsp:Transcript_7766/g.21628  ORF Transcript_7766/g.21628 Transcript_7766/m.21628 type:complete len:380 (-) Transcript_7766:202-1341(-)
MSLKCVPTRCFIAKILAFFYVFLATMSHEARHLFGLHYRNVLSVKRTRRIRRLKKPSLYVCGWDVGFNSWVLSVFNDFELKGTLGQNHQANFTRSDIAVIGQRGPCPVQREWINQNFQGEIVYVNGEEYGPFYNRGREYVMGNIGNETNNNSFYFPYGLSVTLWKNPQLMGCICDPDKKVRSTNKKFLIYSNSHCVDFREKTFRELSSIGKVEYGGLCNGGPGIEGNKSNRIEAPVRVSRNKRNSNPSLYGEYRYCLVMENKQSPGYISEKMVYAYLGGCIPIYYGDKDKIFDLFNHKSFIFHDVHETGSTLKLLQRISDLETRPEAFERMMREPVLAHGNETIKKYLSIYDEYGDGHLKAAMRQFLGLTAVVNEAMVA